MCESMVTVQTQTREHLYSIQCQSLKTPATTGQSQRVTLERKHQRVNEYLARILYIGNFIYSFYTIFVPQQFHNDTTHITDK